MATPLTIAIPPLLDGQTIAAWQPLFVSAVSALEDRAAVKLLPAYLKRGRLEEKIVLSAIQKESLAEAFNYLKERLDPEEDEFVAASNFRKMIWTPGEAVQDFFARYLEEAVKAKLTPRAACTFMVSQAPLEIQQKLKDWVKPKEEVLSVEDALGFGSVLRKLLEGKGIPTDRGCRIQLVTARTDDELQPAGEKSGESDGGEREAQGVKVVNNRKYRSFDRKRTPKCYTCGAADHFMRSCPNRFCSRCGEAGHNPTDCPRGIRGRTGFKHRTQRPNVYQVSNHEEAVTVEVKIGTHKVAAVLDTGARPSVIDIGTARRLELMDRLVAAPSRVYGLCNNPVKISGYLDVAIQVGMLEPVIERVQVLDSTEATLLLGRRFMGHFGPVTFDWANGRVKLGHTWVTAQSLLSGATPLARALAARQDEEGERVNVAGDLGARFISSELGEMEDSRLRILLAEFDGVFSRNHKRPARCKLNETHRILTGDAPPQKLRPRRVPPHWEPEIDRQLEEMLAAEPPICRPSKSPWASDVVLVKKKEGSMRFAVDYRRLNTVTKRDEYSLPNPQSIFDKLEGNRFYSKLDIASAYWTIPIAPEDIEKTAFHTPRGLYEMLVMPFGLCNAPATFQRIMDHALYRVPHVESYVDDILIFSPDFEAHLGHLREVLKHLQAAGLQLRREKCEIGFSSVEFLGHRISFEGRTPVPGYTHRLQSFPQPKGVAELQRFLGTANYYRCYIENMSGIAEPLYSLLKKGKEWAWNEKCQTAFEELRTRLTNEPVTLAHPSWNSEFYIEGDASLVGIAAVLSQLDEKTGKLRPIQYFSSSLSPSQKNYSAGQLEAWALVAATRKWSVYLKGAAGITLLTDHCPLQWLKQQRDPKHTYARWLMELQELPFKIGYRPGGIIT